MEYSIDIIIPTYKPDSTFEKLISRLQKQTVRPQRILVVNTGEELWEQAEFDKSPFVFGTLSGMHQDRHIANRSGRNLQIMQSRKYPPHGIPSTFLW